MSISSSATDIICIDGKAMRGTLYENGRNPDIVSAYSLGSGFTLATDVCKEKSNEIKSVPRLLDKLDVSGCVVTADAMSFQKAIIDKIRDKGADFVIELKANQRSLRYGLEDSIKTTTPTDVYKEGPYLEHGRIETKDMPYIPWGRTYCRQRKMEWQFDSYRNTHIYREKV